MKKSLLSPSDRAYLDLVNADRWQCRMLMVGIVAPGP